MDVNQLILLLKIKLRKIY